MNVKQGDIARLVESEFDANRNRLVSVLRRCTCLGAPLHLPYWECEALQPMACWNLDGPVTIDPAGTVRCVADADLRPLHDGDGEDEMLRIAGKPEQTYVESRTVALTR